MSIRFADSVELVKKPEKTSDGYLVASARVARSGIQIYTGAEMGRPDLDTVAVFRPEEEVFNDATMRTFAYRPMTNDHPESDVTADNWKKLAIGQVGGEVARDGEYIRVPLVLMDAAAIADYENGKRELSAGYSCDIEWTAGVTDTGERYDAIQRNIRNNHLALVDRGRAGSKARIGDKQTKTEVTKTMGTRKITHDNLTIEVSEQAAEVIAELNRRIEEAALKASEELEAVRAEVDAKDALIAERDTEIEKLKAAEMTPEKMADAVAKRVELETNARRLVDMELSGTDAEIKKAVLVELLGDSMKDKSEAYIDARFDAELDKLDDDAGRDTKHQRHGDSDQKRPTYEQRLTDAWRRKK